MFRYVCVIYIYIYIYKECDYRCNTCLGPNRGDCRSCKMIEELVSDIGTNDCVCSSNAYFNTYSAKCECSHPTHYISCNIVII